MAESTNVRAIFGDVTMAEVNAMQEYLRTLYTNPDIALIPRSVGHRGKTMLFALDLVALTLQAERQTDMVKHDLSGFLAGFRFDSEAS